MLLFGVGHNGVYFWQAGPQKGPSTKRGQSPSIGASTLNSINNSRTANTLRLIGRRPLWVKSDRAAPAARQAKSAMSPKAEVNSEHCGRMAMIDEGSLGLRRPCP